MRRLVGCGIAALALTVAALACQPASSPCAPGATCTGITVPPPTPPDLTTIP